MTTTVVFDENGLASMPGNIRVYYYDPDALDYVGWSDEFINIGVSLPGNSVAMAPPDAPEGHVAVFKSGSWDIVRDYRGETAYATDGSGSIVISKPGGIGDGYTLDAPTTVYDVWSGTEWVTDADKLKAAQVAEATAARNALRTKADSEATPLQDAVDLQEATDEEAALLKKWKQYRIALSRIDLSTAPEITWPEIPAS